MSPYGITRPQWVNTWMHNYPHKIYTWFCWALSCCGYAMTLLWIHGHNLPISPCLPRNHFVFAPSQWEMTLQCNVISHWLGAPTKLSLLPWLSHNGMLASLQWTDPKTWVKSIVKHNTKHEHCAYNNTVFWVPPENGTPLIYGTNYRPQRKLIADHGQ